jgi:hypothetical protein
MAINGNKERALLRRGYHVKEALQRRINLNENSILRRNTEKINDRDFKLANILNNRDTLELAKDAAVALCEKDPSLQLPEHASLRQFLTIQKNKIGWGKIA